MRIQNTVNLLGSLNGSAIYLGTISATTTAANFTTGLASGMTIMLQAVGDVYVLPCSPTSMHEGATIPTITSSNGILLADGEKFMMTLPDVAVGGPTASVQAITASGTASVKVFKLS